MDVGKNPDWFTKDLVDIQRLSSNLIQLQSLSLPVLFCNPGHVMPLGFVSCVLTNSLVSNSVSSQKSQTRHISVVSTAGAIETFN